MKLTPQQTLEYFRYQSQYHMRKLAMAELARRKKDKPGPFLLGEYLVTGSDTLVPNPIIPQPSFNAAVARLNFLFDLESFGQQEGLIWAPVAIVRRGSVTKLEVPQ